MTWYEGRVETVTLNPDFPSIVNEDKLSGRMWPVGSGPDADGATNFEMHYLDGMLSTMASEFQVGMVVYIGLCHDDLLFEVYAPGAIDHATAEPRGALPGALERMKAAAALSGASRTNDDSLHQKEADQ